MASTVVGNGNDCSKWQLPPAMTVYEREEWTNVYFEPRLNVLKVTVQFERCFQLMDHVSVIS